MRPWIKKTIYLLKNQYKSYKNSFKKQTNIQLKYISLFIRDQIKVLGLKPYYKFIAKTKGYQLTNYKLIKSKFSKIYNNLRNCDIQKFTTPSWDKNNNILEAEFFPFPQFSFLNHPVIRGTMFLSSRVKWIKEELKFIETKVKFKELRYILLEDYIGIPEISNPRYITSNTTIHHFYSISKFLDVTKCELDKIKTIVEWGGGYGNMAKILLRMINKKITYVIIDTPLFSCIQWLYLASIFGIHNIKIIQNPNDKIVPLKINLLPVCFVENYELNADLFISTWALSESSKFSHKFVVKSKMFNSKHILLAYNVSGTQFPDAIRIEKYAKEMKLIIEKVRNQSNSYYAMK